MSITKNELKLETTNNAIEEQIPDQAKPIIDKFESQIESIVKGFNQVFIDHGVPEATIGKFQYIIQISIPATPNPIPQPSTNSAPLENSPDSGDGGVIEMRRVERSICPVTDPDGTVRQVPCIIN